MNNFTIYERITMEILVDRELRTQEETLKAFIKPPVSDSFFIKHCMEKIATLYTIKEKLYRAERGL